LQTDGKKAARRNLHAFLMTGAAVALSGCVSAGDPSMFASQGFAPGTPAMTGNSSIDQADAFQMASAAEAATSDTVPVPVPSPNSPDASTDLAAAGQTEAEGAQPLVMANTAVDAINQGITQSQPVQTTANLYSAAPVVTQLAVAESAAPDPAPAAPTTITEDTEDSAASEPAETQVQELAVVAPPKKPSIFARLFAPQAKAAANAPAGTKQRLVSPKAPQVVVASASSGNTEALPGVRMSAVFGIGSDSNSSDEESGAIQLASAAGLARLAPNGLRLQTDKVEAGCFKPELVRVLKSIERHYNRPLVVTSGYRSPKHNRRVGGASGSRHTSCEAADIQVEGVSKWQLAKYLRTMPARGGVGTYCHTESVHIDIGTPRDWNWRCRRRK